MKKLLYFVFLLSLIACGDTRSEDDCFDPICVLLGEWEWTHTYGSIAGSTWTPDTEGLTRSLIIDDQIIKFLENGSVLEEFNYEVIESDTIISGSLWTFIKYGNNTRILELADSTMVFRDLCPDCYDDHYEKK